MIKVVFVTDIKIAIKCVEVKTPAGLINCIYCTLLYTIVHYLAVEKVSEGGKGIHYFCEVYFCL